jgi:hypothetical protein
MAFKPSPLSEDLLQKWKVSLETPDINQVKFNSLVKKSAIRHFRDIYINEVFIYLHGLEKIDDKLST